MRYLALAFALLLIAPHPALAADPYVDLNVRNADLSAVLDLIATQADVNIVVDGSAPTKTVTLRLHHIPLTQAIKAIEQAYGMAGSWQGSVLHLGDPAVVNRTYPSGSGVTQYVFTVHNTKANNVVSVLSNVLPPGTLIVADPMTNSVLIKGSPLTIATARQMLGTLDAKTYGTPSNSTYAQVLSYIRASDAVNLIRSSVQAQPPNSIMANDVPNEAVITGTPDFVASVRGMLFNLDRPGKEVMFKIRVTDITPINDQTNIGILFGGASIGGTQTAGTYATTTTFVNNAVQINATLNALVQKGDAKILAEPSLAALDNQQATLNLGEQYPIVYYDAQIGTEQVQFVSAGVILKLTPQVGDSNDITANLDVEYSQILSFVQNYPVIGQRQATTTMRIGNDQAIVIAGLFSDVTSETVSRIPWLSDIPIIGAIFKNRQTSHVRDEIVFLVQPHVIGPEDFQKPLNQAPRPPCSRTDSYPC